MRSWAIFLLCSATAAAQTGTAPPPAAAAERGGRGGPAGANPRELRFGLLRPIQMPKSVNVTLGNGMKIWLVEDHELPMIDGLALVRTGTILDPPEKIGLAGMAGELLRAGGTATKNPEQLDALLETMAATIDSTMEDSYAKLSFNGLAEKADGLLELFREVLAQPGFRQDRIDLVRAKRRNAIARRNEDPAAVARRELAGAIYGKDSAYGWMEQYDTVDKITRSDLRAFHQRYFFPANVSLGVWGDFDTDRMKASLERVFGAWDAATQAAPDFPKVKDVPAPGMYVAEKKDLNEAYFAIGHLGGRASDKDLAALQVMSAILGNGARGRLATQSRARTGAPHEIRASWMPGYGHPGLFEITGSTRASSTVDVLKVVRAEIERIRASEASEEELQTAREVLLSGLVFANDTRGKLMARQLVLDYYGYPGDYLAQQEKAIEAVTRADVLRVARQYLAPAKLATVIVANPQLIPEPLEQPGSEVIRIDLTIPEARKDSAPSTEASLAEGKRLLQRAQAAAGGVEKLAAVKDYTETATFQMDAAIPNIGGTRVIETDRWIWPTHMRQDSTLASGRVAAYTDGKIGWIAAAQGWGPLVGPQQKQVMGDLFRSWFRLLLSDRIEGRTVNAIDSASVEITDSTGQEARVEFDPDTGLPRRVTYDTPHALGAPVYTEDLFEEMREVDGIKMPFKITINQAGRRFAEATVSEYKLNTGLKVMDLARRPL
ncbi:MAG TPA: pitrilysin family protein [Candidatus Acidoferrales bacterium]|nr:pitrilysin family protein [Candidatus Acidoferrales bacterium]